MARLIRVDDTSSRIRYFGKWELEDAGRFSGIGDFGQPWGPGQRRTVAPQATVGFSFNGKSLMDQYPKNANSMSRHVYEHLWDHRGFKQLRSCRVDLELFGRRQRNPNRGAHPLQREQLAPVQG